MLIMLGHILQLALWIVAIAVIVSLLEDWRRMREEERASQERKRIWAFLERCAKQRNITRIL